MKQVNFDVRCYGCRVYSMCQKLIKHIYMENVYNMNHKPLIDDVMCVFFLQSRSLQ